LNKGIDIRPTIAVTKAHMRLLELEKSVKEGKIKVDGKIVLNDVGELAVTKGIPSKYLAYNSRCGTGVVFTRCSRSIRDR
jgi:hypothetical protein